MNIPIQKHLLFICTGNTCRSPMAAAVFNHFAELQNSDWFASSAGLATETGSKISQNTIDALREHDIYIEDYQSYQLEERMIKDADIVLTMTDTQRDLLRIYFPIYKDKIFSFAEYMDYHGDIPDPYGKDITAYREIAKIFIETMPKLVEKLKQQEA